MFDETFPAAGLLLCQILALGAGAAILAAAALHDVAARTIPNRNCLAIAALGLALRWADGHLAAALLLGLTVFAGAAFCWRRGWLGGGDVKLLAAAAVLVPPGGVLGMLCDTALAGGLVALVYLAARRWPASATLQPPTANISGGGSRPLLPRVLRAERWRLRRGGPLPYGSAIALGTLFVLFTG